MIEVLKALSVFFAYAVMAVFAQNAVLSLIHISEPTRP